jgi:hypothetical protein
MATATITVVSSTPTTEVLKGDATKTSTNYNEMMMIGVGMKMSIMILKTLQLAIV